VGRVVSSRLRVRHEKFILLSAKRFGGRAPGWHTPCLCAGNMIDPIFQSDNYQLARKLLDAAALRQEAIAANVANVETPGYRRIDVSADFAERLRAEVATGGLTRTADALKPSLTEDTHARSLRPDGNTVEIEKELLAMNRNAVEYEFLAEIVSRNIKQLKVAITGRTV
jgi:flagellar basal-body rod protein FlgB